MPMPHSFLVSSVSPIMQLHDLETSLTPSETDGQMVFAFMHREAETVFPELVSEPRINLNFRHLKPIWPL